jgi:hypothetical protein
MTPFFTSTDLLATEETSAHFCLYPDNVGIRTRAIAVIGSQPIEIVRIGAQPSNILASRIADVQIPVPWNVTVKRTAGGHIQPVTGRPAYTVPVRSETAGGHIGRV